MINISYKAKRILCMLLAMIMIMGVTVNVPAATPKISVSEKTVYIGNTLQLKVTGGTVSSWKSSNSSIAKVSSKGKVTAVKKGTATIKATLQTGKTLSCTINARSKTKSSYLTNGQVTVALNMLGAVETGGQVYGRRDYADFTNPYAASPGEHSSTAGAYQEFGDNLRQLLVTIKKEYPVTFKKYDNASIASDIKRTWSSSNPYKVYAGSKKAKAIVKIISSNGGKVAQDYRAIALYDSYLKHIRRLGVTNVQAALFMAECEHLGGAAAVERVIKRAGNKNSISSLRTSLYKDQKDTSNSYQIGDSIYKSRHEKCYKWIKQYISSSAKLRK